MVDNTAQRIKMIIAKEFGLKPKSVTNQTQFMSNPNFSYFCCLDALYTLQHKFRVELPESDYDQYKTVGSLTRCIVNQLKSRSK